MVFYKFDSVYAYMERGGKLCEKINKKKKQQQEEEEEEEEEDKPSNTLTD
jgi:hypothetical protein